jgi:hypothetical protein
MGMALAPREERRGSLGSETDEGWLIGGPTVKGVFLGPVAVSVALKRGLWLGINLPELELCLGSLY